MRGCPSVVGTSTLGPCTQIVPQTGTSKLALARLDHLARGFLPGNRLDRLRYLVSGRVFWKRIASGIFLFTGPAHLETLFQAESGKYGAC